MIWESCYWKDDLLRRATSLDKRRSQRRWPAASLAKLEQEIMLAAYSIRKLSDAAKFSDAVRDGHVATRTFKRRAERVTFMNWHRIDEHYDLDHPAPSTLAARNLCNQLIHSYVFIIEAGPDGLEGFYVTSDRDRHSVLRHVAINDFISLLRKMGEDYPNESRITWNDERGDYDVTARTRGPEEEACG